MYTNLGYRPRPYDPKAEKYAVSRLWAILGLDVSAVDINQPRSLANFQGKDCRVPITNQGALGACAAFAAIEAAEMAANANGWRSTDDPPLNYGLDYELARIAEGSFPNDAGSNPADCLQFVLNGLPLDSDMPYTQQAATDYRGIQNTDVHKYLAGFSPFSNTQNTLFHQNICQSFDLGHPVILATNWYQPWFQPDGLGVLPTLTPGSNPVGGHAFVAYSRLQTRDGRWGYGCANHWTNGWDPQVVNSGLRPGDFIITDDMLILTCMEGWTVVGGPAPNPNPNPNPAPPTPTPPAHYVPVGDCVPFWDFIQKYPIFFQNAMDIWGPRMFHPRGCA